MIKGNVHGSSPVSTRSRMRAGARRWLFAGAAGLAIFSALHFSSGRTVIAASTAKPAQVVATGAVPPPAMTAPFRIADFGGEKPSPDARHVADWIADSGNNAGMDFIIVDKNFARVFTFDSAARLLGASPVLLGSARGDESVPGIGSRPIAQVRPSERTTPAGRFVGERGRNALGEDVVWVDYDAAVSMHRVRATNAKEHRLERLATATIDDNRISYGCINVPVVFYESHIRPLFATRRALVYVLPEVKSAQQVFGSYDVAAAHMRAVH
ncbi:MAG: hypothetical protein ABI790_15665 [Betaproteobacteria bacterium]